MAAALSTFSSNGAAVASDACAEGAATLPNATVRARAARRLFGAMRSRLKQSLCHEIAHDFHRLRRDLVPHRELVVLRLDTVLFEQPPRPPCGQERDHIVLGAVNDQYRHVLPRLEVGRVGLSD